MKSLPKIKKKIEIAPFYSPENNILGAESEQESSLWISHPSSDSSDHLISAIPTTWVVKGVTLGSREWLETCIFQPQ